MTPGEVNADGLWWAHSHVVILILRSGYADGYLSNRSINGQIGECSCKSVWFCLISPAEQQNGSAIILEHRFYGLSNPIDNLKTESLKLHTIQQAIDDLEYFAKNVVLPQPDGDQVTPDKTPWILAGGSYSGAYIKTVVSM